MEAENSQKVAVIVLIADREVGKRIVGALEALALQGVKILMPPVRGKEFFSEENLQELVDSWWSRNVPKGAETIFLLEDENGLEVWLKGLSGRFFVSSSEDRLQDYDEFPAVSAQETEDEHELISSVMKEFPEYFQVHPSGQEDVDNLEGEVEEENDEEGSEWESDDEAAAKMLAELGIFQADEKNASEEDGASEEEDELELDLELEEEEDSEDEEDEGKDSEEEEDEELPVPVAGRRRFQGSGRGEKTVPVPIVADNPFDALVASPGLQERFSSIVKQEFSEGETSLSSHRISSKAGGIPKSTKKSTVSSILPQVSSISSIIGRLGRGKSGADPRDLGHLIKARQNLVVLVASRKGGVGKTTTAGALALDLAEVAASIGGKAAFVDFNLTNPDAWGQFGLPEEAATVREAIARLSKGAEPPSPVYAKDTVLACYPSDRESAEYTQTEIDRFAEYLKRRYLVVVVDLANHMPGIGTPAGEAVAYWMEHADVLVLPSNSAKNSFNGVLDYLELQQDLPPVVVPYIPSKDRSVREHSVTKEYLKAIADRGASIVEIPNEAKVDLADYDAIPIIDITPALRDGYWRLTEAVISMPQRR